MNKEREKRMANRVQVIKEASKGFEGGDWRLCFQWCLYVYDNGTSEHGYRFIWRKENGNLQGARGQARIPSVRDIDDLVAKARVEGWANYDGDELGKTEF